LQEILRGEGGGLLRWIATLFFNIWFGEEVPALLTKTVMDKTES
jgi:hypothetical protein